MDYEEMNYQSFSRDRQLEASYAFPALMRKTYLWMSMALVITGLTAYVVATNAAISNFLFMHSQLIWVLFLAEIGLVIGLSAAIRKISLSAATLMFVAYAAVSNLKAIDLLNPIVVVGLFIGSMLPFLFSAMTMNSVGKAANQMIEEVRRQFREDKGIMAGTSKPDYKRCVSISTGAALKEMIMPGVMAIIAPIAVGIILGPAALGGMLAGSLAAGVLLAIMMANAGGAWDNAKKYIEGGAYGGKGSETHKAAVVGDTVGDPFKDTSGPSINILIKLMTIIAVVFAPLFVSIGGLLK